MELLAGGRTLPMVMNRSRHQRLRVRLSILAIVALLWSQFVLASHPAASMAAMAAAQAVAPVAMERDCHRPEASDESAICAAHCSQSDQSSEVGRVPPVPALAPAAVMGIASIAMLGAERAPNLQRPPPVSWHRPTSHPASLLLI